MVQTSTDGANTKIGGRSESRGSATYRRGCTIWIDRRSSSDFLVTSRGDPVWPACNCDEWRELTTICEAHSIDLRRTRGLPRTTKRLKGVVVGFGTPEVYDSAQLYAHLTRRHFHSAANLEELTNTVPEVVVTTFAHLKADLLHTLYVNAKPRSAPGLICATGPDTLRRQVILRSIFARRQPPDGRFPWTGFFPTLNMGTRAAKTYQLLGAHSATEHVRAALESGSGVLLIATHGDGID